MYGFGAEVSDPFLLASWPVGVCSRIVSIIVRAPRQARPCAPASHLRRENVVTLRRLDDSAVAGRLSRNAISVSSLRKDVLAEPASSPPLSFLAFRVDAAMLSNLRAVPSVSPDSCSELAFVKRPRPCCGRLPGDRECSSRWKRTVVVAFVIAAPSVHFVTTTVASESPVVESNGRACRCRCGDVSFPALGLRHLVCRLCGASSAELAGGNLSRRLMKSSQLICSPTLVYWSRFCAGSSLHLWGETTRHCWVFGDRAWPG